MRKFLKYFIFIYLFCIFINSTSFSHSRVSGTTPIDGSVLEKAPESFFVTFNEKVTIPSNGFKIIDSSGNIYVLNNIISKNQGNGMLVEAEIDIDIINWAAISYSVISLDGHQIDGIVSFSVGENLSSAKNRESLLDELSKDPLGIYKKMLQIVKYISYLTSLLIIGLLGFLFFISKVGKKNGYDLEGNIIKYSNNIITTIALIGATAAPLMIFLNTFILNSGEFEDFGIAFSISIGTSTGLSLLIKTSSFFALSTAALLIIDKKTKTIGNIIFLIASIALLYSYTLSGHTDLVPKELLSKISIVLHLLAGGLWLGGLVILSTLLLRKKIESKDKVLFISGFSYVATFSLLLLLPSSVILSYTMFTTPSELLTSEYGNRLLLKIGFVFFLALIGAYNHYVLVPKMKKDESEILIKKVIYLESFGLFIVLFFTSMLTNYGAPAAGGSHITHLGNFNEELSRNPDLADILPTISRAPYKDGEIEVRVEPSRAGVDNRMEIIIKDKNNYVIENIKKVSIEISVPKLNKKIFREAEKNSIGNWEIKSNDFGFSGLWDIDIIINSGSISQEKASLTIPIKAGISEDIRRIN